MDNEKDFLEFLKKEEISTFQTKGLSEMLKKEQGIPKIKTKIWISILKTNGIIERASESGYCETICASCYEYGCDAGMRPPINFWKLTNKTTN